MLALTRCRRSEVLDLRWRNIDGDALKLVDAKAGPRSPDAFLFERYAEGRGAYSLTECRHTAREWAKLGRLRLHDLRHSFASRALALGYDLTMIGRLLGHRKPQTTARYAHLARHSVKTVADRIADNLVADMRAFADNPHKA